MESVNVRRDGDQWVISADYEEMAPLVREYLAAGQIQYGRQD